MAKDKIKKFRKIVWMQYRKNGRHKLPWRKTRDPYKILVSEVMLQQTQVERVIPFYKKFIKTYPTARRLAEAKLSDVLKVWQGLGYNRRAKMLHSAAKKVARATLATRLNLVKKLEELPGVGPYTARAVAAFAFNQDVIFVETNIRTAVIHHFFSTRNTSIYGSISDSEIEEILKEILPKGRAREWYSALMDYGAYLKRSGISHNTRSNKYTKQSRFAGSLRQARGALLRELALGTRSEPRLLMLLGDDRKLQLQAALTALITEGFVMNIRNHYTLID